MPASKIFTGNEWLPEHAIVIENKIVKDIVTLSSLGTGTAVESFKNCILVPSFIDLNILVKLGLNNYLFPDILTIPSATFGNLVKICISCPGIMSLGSDARIFIRFIWLT